MRPHQPTARIKAAGLARARMLIKAKLGWLGGYPSANGWVAVPEDERPVEQLALSRDHLRRATYTANKLRGEFPRALPKLVGDASVWHAAVSHVLAVLKPWVHHGQPPPVESQCERLLAIGTAMEALHRPAQAIRLYERAQRACGADYQKALATARIAALARHA